MDQSTILVIVGVLAGLGVTAWWLRSRSTPEGDGAERAEPEPKPSAEPEAAVEPEPEPKPSAEPEAVAEPEPEPKPSAEPEAAAEPEATVEPEPEPKPSAEPEAAAEPEPEPKPSAEPEAAAEPVPQPPPAPRRPRAEEVAELRKGLRGTRGGFVARLAGLFGGRKEIDPALLEEIEEVLLTADIGVKTTERLLEALRERLGRNELKDPEAVWAALKEEALSILDRPGGELRLDGASPAVVLVVGVNGTGKTTTIGKLAHRLSSEGKKPLLAAGDTFRAAAVLQLEVWARRVGCEVHKGKDKADPASVAFGAVERAKAEGHDVVVVDTAGRLHTRTPLMDELKKVARAVEKARGERPNEVILVLDATTGQNALQQARLFHEAMDLSGIVLTKLDGTAKGGVILGIVEELGLPVRYIGIGERIEDLRPFDAPSFVEALFAPDEDAVEAAG